MANDHDNGGNGLSALVSSAQVSRPSSRTNNNNSNDGSVFGGFSPSTGIIGGSDASGGGGMAIGRRAFDYDPANDYDNGNSLAALASSLRVPRPSSRANNYDGSAIGNLSPITGLGGSSAMGVCVCGTDSIMAGGIRVVLRIIIQG